MDPRPKGACKDCWQRFLDMPNDDTEEVFKQRPAPYPGPRCATDNRAAVKDRKAKAHERHVVKEYGLSEGDYEKIYRAQGGHCFLCQRSTGRAKRLPVDHDHATGYVRGLLCGPCNKNVMGQARDSIAYFERCIEYLRYPPAVAVIGWKKAS